MGYSIGKYENQSAVASASGTSSIQIFASVGGSRWALGAGLVNWYHATVSLSIIFKEVGNEVSADTFCFLPSTSSGQWGFNFLPLGLRASDTNTALKIETSDQGSITGWFTGFYE